MSDILAFLSDIVEFGFFSIFNALSNMFLNTGYGWFLITIISAGIIIDCLIEIFHISKNF